MYSDRTCPLPLPVNPFSLPTSPSPSFMPLFDI